MTTTTPWQLLRVSTDALTVEHSSDGLRSVVARLYDSDLCPEHGGTLEANGRLLVSAPELLAALEELVADPYLSDPINSDRMRNARAAIAKATGNA